MKQKYNTESDTLRGQLGHEFPYDEFAPIPRNVFQTWKTARSDPSFPKPYASASDSWHKQNVENGYRHYVMPDAVLDDWVHTEYAHVPDVVVAWDLLPKIILKADFFRYLVVFARGGVYSDIDTFCLKPIDIWPLFREDFTTTVDENGKKSVANIGLAVGIEADPDRPDWYEWYARRIQFVQWTIIGKKGHPFLRELIARVVEETLRKEKMGVLKKIEGKDAGGDVMSWTGPGIFTDTMFDYLNNVVSGGKYGDGYGIGSQYWVKGEKYKLKTQEIDDDGMPITSKDMEINYKSFTGLVEPVVHDDVMVLPITCFSPGVGQMGSKGTFDKMAMVAHNFSGSWKTP